MLNEINGHQLYWEITGQAGDPMVLVHGAWSDHHAWDRIVPALARSFRVVTYDRRGHSQSERPPGQGSLGEDVADLAALIEHLDLAPAHILGNSSGGSIVLRLACERPEVFRSLLVHEPPLFGLLDDDPAGRRMLQAVQERTGAVVELLEQGRVEAGTKLFMETVAFGPGAWEQIPVERREIFVFNAPTFLDAMRDPQRLAFDLQPLAKFSSPALLTNGDRSEPFFPLVVEKVARMFPRAQRVTIRGAGHLPQLSHPLEYVETVAAFIAASPAA